MNTASNTSALARVVARTRYVLLDFDGPICKVFTDPTANAVAARLVEVIEAHGVDTPQQVIEAGPHDVLQYAATVSRELTGEVEEALRELEVSAAATAAPTPGADELLESCQRTGRAVAVVSNNAAEAVAAYMDRSELSSFVAHVQGRDPQDPALMKPSPFSIDRALKALGADSTAAALVGDSVSDMQASSAAGISCIGYANKPGKREQLMNAHADAVADTMTDVAKALTAHPVLRTARGRSAT